MICSNFERVAITVAVIEVPTALSDVTPHTLMFIYASYPWALDAALLQFIYI